MAKYIVCEDELYHHGIEGQKWGQRRWQNPDGSLTPEGRARYGKLEKKIAKQTKKVEKAQVKLDKFNKSKAIKVAKLKAKSAKYRNKAYNGLFVTKKKAEKYEFKAKKIEAKADKLQAKADKQQAKIEKAKALINKYNRDLKELEPSTISSGKKFIDERTKDVLAESIASNYIRKKYPNGQSASEEEKKKIVAEYFAEYAKQLQDIDKYNKNGGKV